MLGQWQCSNINGSITNFGLNWIRFNTMQKSINTVRKQIQTKSTFFYDLFLIVLKHIISARQHICFIALYAIARPSVRLSVCLSHGWIMQKRLVRIMQFSPWHFFMTIVRRSESKASINYPYEPFRHTLS